MSEVIHNKRERKTQNISQSLHQAVFFLKLFGMWHVDGKFGTIYRIYGNIVLILAGFLYAASMLMNVVVVWGNIPEMAEGIYLLVTIVSLALKFSLLDYKKMLATIEMLNCEPFRGYTEEQDAIIDEFMYTTKRNIVLFQLSCTAVCWSWCAMPLVNGTYKMKQLPMKAWYPYRTDWSPAYEMTFLYQFLGVWIGGLFNTALDTLITGLMNHACGQLNILKHSLTHIRRRAMLSLNQHDELCSCGDNVWRCLRPVHLKRNPGDLEDQICKEVIVCIKHHKAIIEFVTEIQSTFTGSIFAQLCGSVITICITGVQLSILKPFSPPFVVASMYCLVITIQVYLYCWYGNEVFVTSSTVRDAVYMADWYQCGPRVNRLLFIIMERSKQPMRLTAAKLFQLSLDTFTSILRSAYSLFAVIQQMDMDV